MASCDHYLIDLYSAVLDANGVTYAMLPWLTVLRDCYTKSVLAFWITLKSPSRRNCALMMRQCLRRHGRLPETIIVDGGADFSSVYFSGLLAHCKVNLMRRPSGHPRYGSEAERFFGQFKDLWLSLRPGNKISIKEVRSVSGSHRPEKHACLSLLDLWEDLLAFSEWFDSYATDSSLASPRVLMQRGLAQYGCLAGNASTTIRLLSLQLWMREHTKSTHNVVCISVRFITGIHAYRGCVAVARSRCALIPKIHTASTHWSERHG
ncbi:hypothetical protein RLIN73S_05978 [Rhodanobacter lindaniclasticus]